MTSGYATCVCGQQVPQTFVRDKLVGHRAFNNVHWCPIPDDGFIELKRPLVPWCQYCGEIVIEGEHYYRGTVSGVVLHGRCKLKWEDERSYPGDRL